MARRPQRGITFVTVLILVGILAGTWWALTFGPAYWDNLEVKKMLREAANYAYQQKEDGQVRIFIERKIREQFQVGGDQTHPQLSIEYDPGDLRIERTKSPDFINIWFTYSRTVKTPFTAQERQVTFTDHAEQDLSPVKW